MRLTALLSICALLSACGPEDPQGPAKDKQDRQQEHVWRDQTDTLDKAREVEQILQDDAERKRKQLEEQED
jgi:outer membrane biogenesis lipoprotein LolB